METIRARITYQIPDGVYVNVGTDQGVRQGLRGSVLFDDGRIIACEVLQAARKTALLRLDGLEEAIPASLREQPIDLVFQQTGQPENGKSTTGTQTQGRAGSAALSADTEPFVPLLTPIKRTPEFPPSSNISRGQIGVRHSFQTAPDDQQEYAITRGNTYGSIERIQGTPWSFIWSGNATFRSGEAYRRHDDYQSVRLAVYKAVFERPLLEGDGGFLRLGRFLPIELPGIGYLDGGQLEIKNGENLRFGVLAGLKPSQRDLEVSVDEPTAAGYVTVESGNRDAAYYSGTVGLLGALFEGQADRLALLLDQRASYGSRFSLYSTAEIDFGIADTTNSATKLTRLNLVASQKFHDLFTLRAGLDHWQRPDTLAQRDLLEIVDDRIFDDGYWRYWVGGRHKLPWKLRLNEEISYTVSDASDDAARWRVGLSRTGLLLWPNASVRATLYNLEAQGADGYGGLLSAYLPLWHSKLTIRPAAGLRWLDSEARSDGLSVTYYSLHADSRLSKAWMFSGGVTVYSGDGADATLFDLGLRYKW